MRGDLLKAFIVVIFTFWAILIGVTKSMAQSDSASDEQAQEDQARQTLNQIHDLELKMEDNAKRLDALEKSVNQSDKEAPEEVPVEEVPAQTVTPVQDAPIQFISTETSPEKQSIPEMETEPVDLVPQAPAYYEPLTAYPKEHSFELSQEDFYSSYRESGEHRSGAFFGVNSAYSYRPWDSQYWPINVFHVDVHGDYGQVNYNFGDDGKTNNINNYTIEPRAWVGKDLIFGLNNSLTPYVGAGYRWYYEELKNKMTDEEQIDGLNFQLRSNNTQTQYVYIPLGAQLSVHPIGGWRIDMNSEYDFLVWGRVTNYAPNLSADGVNIYSPAISNTLRNGYGIRGSIKFTKEGDSCNYFVEPYVRYWNIRSSNTVSDPFTLYGANIGSTPVQQDKNTTTEVGARAGIEF